MSQHSHDGIDWDARAQRLRESDELMAPEISALARSLLREGDRSVIDVGSGAGGSAAAFAAALADVGGAVTVVDSAQELLSQAAACARRAAPEAVEVRSHLADATTEELTGAGKADLVFASFVVHHLPDQMDGLRRLADLARPGGRLAVVESGLPRRVLPWDVGIAEPGLESRLAAAREEWFREMREGMDGSVRLPVGWSKALSDAGLVDVRSWSYLIDRPAPVSGVALNAVLRRLEWLQRAAEGRVNAEDLWAIDQLLDPASPHYVGNRDDVHFLAADTVYVGTRP